MTLIRLTLKSTDTAAVLKFPKIAGANSLFFKIVDAKAPIAPVLNTPPIIITHVRL